MNKKQSFLVQSFKLILLGTFLLADQFANAQLSTDIRQKMIDKEKLRESLANMPVAFQKNAGQWNSEIFYQGTSPAWGATVSFLKTGLSFGFCRNQEKAVKGDGKNYEPAPHEYLVWNLHFKNANEKVLLDGEGKEDSHINYLIGKDFSKHQTNVAAYRKVKYNNIYDKIDISYYSSGANLEYDFILQPGADVSKIQMQFEGVKSLSVNEKGQLEITTEWGTLLEEIPESYQIINGQKNKVQIRYRKIDKATFGFETEGTYDYSAALVIDPINLAWSTFVGGVGGDGYISDIAVDPAGNVYGTGWYNAAFPTTAGTYQQVYKGGGGYGDAYIFKLNANASSYVYATYLGGATSYEQGEGISVNAAGEVYVTGWTQSTDFPTTAGAYNQNFTGTQFQDIWVVKLNAAGNTLLYSTYIGSQYSDYAYALAVNSAGEAYVTGYTTNSVNDFPTTPGAYQAASTPNAWGVYVLKLNASGSALLFSTLTANTGIAYGIAIDAAGNSYLVGTLYGNMTVTPGAFDPTPDPMISIYPDMFVQKVDAAGGNLLYSTYLGGNGTDDVFYGDAIAIDAAGNAYITGETASTNFPTTPGAFDVTQSGGTDPFLLKMNPTGTGLIYSTFLGQNGVGESVAVNSSGEAWVAGNINSQDLDATTCGNYTTWGGGTDCFVIKMDAAGANLLYGSYFGGSGNDYGNGPFGKVKLVLWGQCEDEVFVSTTSHSPNFPTTPGTVQPVKLNSGADQPEVFHLKPKITPNFTFTAQCNVVNFTDLSTGNCIWKPGAWTPTAWQWNFGDGSSSSLQNPSHSYSAPGTYTVTLVVSCPKDSIKIPVTVSPGIVLSTSGTSSGCSGNTGSATVTVTSGTGPFTYTWTPTGGNTSTASNLPPGLYTVTVSNGSCTNQDTVTIGSAGTSPVTSAISGPTPVCPNATGIIYSVNNTTGSTYNWTVPASATITSGQGTATITVDFGATGGTVTCTETNGCGSGTPVSLNVPTSTTPVTSAISGLTPICPNATNTTYSVVNTTGSTYNWTVPAGATIVSGQGTNIIVVNWGANGGTVTCTETSTCGTGSPVSLNVVMGSTPSTSSINGTTPVCPNATNTTYSVTNTAGSTYTWTVPSGATVTSGQGTNSINVNWGTNGGTVTCTESNVCGTGTPVTFTVVMNTIPVTSPISGPSPVCANSTNQTYSVTNVPGNVYSWTVSGGGTIILGQGSNNVFVDWGTTGGVVNVTQTNACGTGTAVTLTVVVVNPPSTGAINGPTPLCPNVTNTTYSVNNTSGSTYTWTVPSGATISSGQGTNSINVNWGSNGGTVTCTESNVCGTATPVTFTVVMNALPATGTISGTTPVCPNQSNVVYTVNNTAGSTYTWTVPSGAAISSGQGSNSIIVNWGTTPGNVTVIESNSCGTGTVVLYPVTMNTLAVTSPISGGNPSCANTNGITYSVSPGASSYTWSVGGGGTLVSGQGTNAITLNWGNTGGVIYCTAYNQCGPGNTVTDTVTFLGIPIATTINGPTPLCPNQNGTIYFVTNHSTSTYTWTVPGGATIINGQGTSSVTVNWGTNGGVVICTEGNMCGTGSPATFTVVMNPLPTTGPISGPSPVCANVSGATYSVAPTSGSTYVWSVPAGAVITGGQGTNTVVVNWSASNGGTITVTETNGCGNGSPVSMQVTIMPVPTISVSASPHSGCGPLAVSFTDNTTLPPGVTITSYSWTFGDGNVSTQQNPSNVYFNAGGYNVTLQITTNSGCTSTYNAINYVNVYPNPTANFTTQEQIIYVSDATVHFLDQSQVIITNWSWSFGVNNATSSQQNPSYTFPDQGNYDVMLTVTNNYGCKDSIRKIIVVKDEFEFWVPNAFTPNGDGQNETFTGVGTNIGDYEMMIFDRWGNLIYKTNDITKPWDGRVKQRGEEVQEDVYVYKIRVTELENKKEHFYEGHISLVK